MVNLLLRNILAVLDITPVSVDVNTNKQTLDDIDLKNNENVTGTKIKAHNVDISSCDKAKFANGGSVDGHTKKAKTSINLENDGKSKTSSRDEVKDIKHFDNGRIIGTTFTNSEFSVKLLHNELCRFQLMGPLCQVVLTQILEAAKVNVNCPNLNSSEQEILIDNEKLSNSQEGTTTANGSLTENTSVFIDDKNVLELSSDSNTKPKVLKWWQKYYSEENASKIHWQQSNMWHHMTGVLSPAELTPHCILGLTVTDPRLQLPAKKGKTYPEKLTLSGQNF